MKKVLMCMLVGGMALGGCSSTKKAAKKAADSVNANQEQTGEGTDGETEVVDLEGIEVTASKLADPYRESEKRVNNLVHTSLDVRFDWEKRHLMGKATLDLKPYFYPTSTLVLDAKGFDINAVTDGNGKALKYDYDGAFITIELGKEYTRNEQYRVKIDYVAKPDELVAGGSIAITDDKGLFFINPDGKEKEKPMQIWTQGEPESSSCWFPTIDSPNENTTQEIFITVQDKYKTLSNGTKVSSKKNGDGTRTDQWKQDIPHAPYLFMMTVGDYAVVTDTWKGKVVDYYVEPEYEKFARKIFPNTVEMLGFFSDLFDYEFPWDKYSQIIVRDYVSGAMENTSAVTFGEFMQGDERFLEDYDGESIVAHELMHHWFGDIVTCESWANLPMNEAFATYGEFLWIEYKYGEAAAGNHLRQYLGAYLGEANNVAKKELIRYRHDTAGDMFDSHTYQKGGHVLHLLRKYVGDEAFFKTLNLYLKDNEYSSVEIHNFRLAMEEVTGEDLNWFFNQWFFRAGHPILDIQIDYDEAKKVSVINLSQTQDEDVYKLPLAVDIYVDGKVVRENITMTEREQSFEIGVASKPDVVNVDAEKILLGEKSVKLSKDEYVHLLKNGPKYLDKYEALYGLQDHQNEEVVQDAMIAAMDDPYWATRSRAALNLDMSRDAIKEKALDRVKKMASSDEKSTARQSALQVLTGLEDPSTKDLFVKTIETDLSYGAVGDALKGLIKVDKETGLAEAKKLEKADASGIATSLYEIYGEYGGEEVLDFFEKRYDSETTYTKYILATNYGKILGRVSDAAKVEKGIDILGATAGDFDGQWFLRMAAVQSLGEVKGALTEKETAGDDSVKPLIDKITGIFKANKEKETNPRLQMMYQMMGL